MNVVVPPLEIEGDEVVKKKTLRQGKRKYYTHKMGAGYKSRCSDIERWQQFASEEARHVSDFTNFSCPYRFICANSDTEDVKPRKEPSEKPTRSVLSDFTTKPLNNEFEIWEQLIRQKVSGKRKNKVDEDRPKPKLRTQLSKRFNAIPTTSNTKDQETVWINPLISVQAEKASASNTEIENKVTVQPKPKTEVKLVNSPTLKKKKKSGTLKIHSIRRTLSKGTASPSSLITKQEPRSRSPSPSNYRTKEKKQKRASLELKPAILKVESINNQTRGRSSSCAVPTFSALTIQEE